ncbi:hypothetical protein [Pedobacter sp. MC2016-05]|uniref:hypothetical protein n=1 Tax=Pedobacter sp. MC2016-05 TaxID=2994474 RepID=UPI00224818BE|nr:hypothetical protein [Pedobacter sp. MC2016-05]
MEKHVRISSSLNQHTKWIEQDLSLGIDRVILHNVNRNQKEFIKDFGVEVLPNLRF